MFAASGGRKSKDTKKTSRWVSVSCCGQWAGVEMEQRWRVDFGGGGEEKKEKRESERMVRFCFFSLLFFSDVQGEKKKVRLGANKVEVQCGSSAFFKVNTFFGRSLGGASPKLDVSYVSYIHTLHTLHTIRLSHMY